MAAPSTRQASDARRFTTGSAVVSNETQGLPGTESLNSRRGMKTVAIDAINAILAARDGRITLIMVVQQLSMLDSSLYPLIDAWLLIRKEPDDPGGPLMTHHKVHINDYELKNPKLRTPAVKDLTWPRLPHDDPDYQEMQRKKHEGKQRGGEDGEESDGPSIPGSLSEMPPEHRDPLIKDYVGAQALTGRNWPRQPAFRRSGSRRSLLSTTDHQNHMTAPFSDHERKQAQSLLIHSPNAGDDGDPRRRPTPRERCAR